MTERLYRSRDDRMIAGVAGGVAEQLDADPSLIRIVWAVLIFLTGGLALVVYIVMAIVVPERPAGLEPGPGGPRQNLRRTDRGEPPTGRPCRSAHRRRGGPAGRAPMTRHAEA